MRVLSRMAAFDLIWAGVSPFLAFLLRDGTIIRVDGVAIYCCIALVASLAVFQWFKISSPIASYFSVHDAWTITQACVTAAALTAAILFIFTRLDEAPRSIPIIHFMVLAGGLIGQRAIARLMETRRAATLSQAGFEKHENVLIIGATRLAWFYSKMVEEFSSHERRIVAILDERPRLYNRTLNSFSIVGSPVHLSRIIDEYATHGVTIDKVVVAEFSNNAADDIWVEVRKTCDARKIPIEWLQERFLFLHSAAFRSDMPVVDHELASAFAGAAYWKIKRFLDIVFVLGAMITIAPLAILVAALVLIDVGYPAVFWQQRIGYLGRPFYIYKFRTMRNTVDRNGEPVPESERLSLFGWLLRRNRLDEIPQLFNILTGRMSLIGPRPLLPVDQPKSAHFRLQVRPGLTGLAQINGGKLLTPDEKDALDEWYVQHVSILVDLKIILRTLWVLVRGDHRNDRQISAAVAEKNMTSKCVPE
jgi:lipopolysaccharide/colanic/teichoic acid biosynthesis glycosyltransferase